MPYNKGDKVCSFDGLRGVVVACNDANKSHASVTVKWFNGLVVTHPLTADDLWLEGQPAKKHPKLILAQQFYKNQDAIDVRNKALLEQYQKALCAAVEAGVNCVWLEEPIFYDVTLADLASEITRWSKLVQSMDGNDKDDDLDHDLFTRECIHGSLNGLKLQHIEIPSDLLDKLASADEYFMQHSIVLNPPSLKVFEQINQPPWINVEDTRVFWYKYRWPRPKAPSL